MTAGRPDFDLVQAGRGPELLLHSLLTDRTVGPRIEDYADRVAELFAALPLGPDVDVHGMSRLKRTFPER